MSRSPRAARAGSAPFAYGGRFRAAVAEPSEPGASSTTWGPPPSTSGTVWTSHRTPTSACRPSPGCSKARRSTATRSGTEQVITARTAQPHDRRPRRLALRRGHRSLPGTTPGVQLWVAQPSTTRDGAPAFEHHDELPRAEFDGAVATVLIGDLEGAASPARRDTDHVGIDLDLRPGSTTLPLRPDYEHALVLVTGAVEVDGAIIEPGHLAYLGVGRHELSITTRVATRAVLVGGVPFDEPVLMWWNFVARTQDEITRAHADWIAAADRFGTVASSLPRIEVGPPPWSRS